MIISLASNKILTTFKSSILCIASSDIMKYLSRPLELRYIRILLKILLLCSTRTKKTLLSHYSLPLLQLVTSTKAETTLLHQSYAVQLFYILLVSSKVQTQFNQPIKLLNKEIKSKCTTTGLDRVITLSSVVVLGHTVMIQHCKLPK